MKEVAPTLTYAELRERVAALARRIGAPSNLLPTYASSEDFARPHIETDLRGYHYVVVERGTELSRSTTRVLDELLYWVFRDVTFSMACSFELAHRQPMQDSRRILFAHNLQLLESLSPTWRATREAALASVLRSHPYRDAPDAHAT
jgi:hypothetical protein